MSATIPSDSPDSSNPQSTITFDNLDLIEPLRRAVAAEGYTVPTPIQRQAIPVVLAGRDLCGVAQTGTGKTAAFALPILQCLVAKPISGGNRPIRVLVLSPTRELATQIGDSFSVYGKHTPITNTVIFGGVGQGNQEKALRRGVDVLVATPGRLLDMMNQRLIKFDRLEVLVLDEADRMLDMGFIHDVRRVIAACPRQRQTLLFSATMPQDIEELARSILIDPARVEVAPAATTAEKIDQSIFFVEKEAKRQLLVHLLANPAISRALVFSRTKHGARTKSSAICSAPISAPRRSTATRRRTRVNGRSPTSSPATRASSSPLTSPRAASTSTGSPTSSTTICRTSPRAMSTASAAPRAPAPRESRSRSAIWKSAST